jgi:DNA sulfur modification protein DndD
VSLRFENVTLKNFGPYRHVDLSLEANPEAPIVVIHGENTLGKTSLFRALRWCLYGSLLPQQTPQKANWDLHHYLNNPAERDGENAMEVSMRFTANESVYQLARRATFVDHAPTVTTDLRINATVVQQASIDGEIGRLLHPQISEFFLFDGELLKDFYDRLNTDRERDFIRESIDTVLGIPALQRAQQDVQLLHEDAVGRQAKAVKSSTDRDKLNNQLRQLKDRQESTEKDRKEIQESVAKAESRLRDVKDEIASIGELQADAREMETLEAQIKGDEAEEKNLREEMRRLLTAGWMVPAAGQLRTVLERVQQANNAADEHQQALRKASDRVEVLREQMKGGLCVTCHQPLPAPDESTRQELTDAEAEMKRLGATTTQVPNLLLERKINSLIDVTTLTRYQDKQARLNAIISAQFDRNRRLSTLKDRLKDNSALKIRQLGDEQEQLETVIDQYERRLKTFKPILDAIAADQQKVARQLSRLPGAQPALAAEVAFFDYVLTLLGRTIERYQERTRQDVESTASEMFVNLVRDAHSYKGLHIGRDYRVELVGQRGEPMITSEGGKQLVALSLIGALKKAAVRGGPVVLDSPLARLDLDHRANVLQRWVPALGNQAILLVQSGELTEEQARDIMGNRIGQEYRIYRPNDDPEEAMIERTQ